MAFSSALFFKYSSPSHTSNYTLNMIASIVSIGFYLIILFLLSCTSHQGFGEFKKKFKEDFVSEKYMTISVLYRLSLGVYMAVSNEQTLGTLFMLFFSIFYILYSITNLPFNAAFQNYRSNLCHITQLIILLVTNYYRSMKHNLPL
jgi:hypothetical protein